jgi:hypothetical protein
MGRRLGGDAHRADRAALDPYQLYNGTYPLVLAGVPLLLALALMRRAARAATVVR